MPQTTPTTFLDDLGDAAHLLTGGRTDYDPLLDLIGDARLTLIGEASHGTHDFYHEPIEIAKHYFHAQLAEQFDAVIHIDETRALEPLERPRGWQGGEVPETYPSGL